MLSVSPTFQFHTKSHFFQFGELCHSHLCHLNFLLDSFYSLKLSRDRPRSRFYIPNSGQNHGIPNKFHPIGDGKNDWNNLIFGRNMNHPNNFPNNNSIMIFCRTSSGWEGRGIHIQWFFMASRSYEQSFQPYDKSRDIDRLFNGYLPSGKLTQLWKITIFHGKIHYEFYKW